VSSENTNLHAAISFSSQLLKVKVQRSRSILLQRIRIARNADRRTS